MTQILRFNWPWYVAAASVMLAFVLPPRLPRMPAFLPILCYVSAACALFWTAAALLVSHWIYDLSPLRQWKWILEEFRNQPTTIANIHAGFDESTNSLKSLFPGSALQVWDIYDPAVMSQRSIDRARQVKTAATRAARVELSSLPAARETLDAAFVIFAAHEIRSSGAREQFFLEVHRILKPGGGVLLVEHLRDWKNFLAFGPGFFHFLPRREWLRLASRAGFCVTRNFTITPFVKILVLTKSIQL